MTGAILPAALTFLICAAIAVYVAGSRQRSPLRAPLLGYLGSMMLLTGGVVWRFSVASDEAAALGFFASWIGMTMLALCWLFLAGRVARIASFDGPSLLWLALALPMLCSWVALSTNDSHHMVLASFSQHEETYGPLFYATVAFVYGYALVGHLLFLRTAARTFLRHSALQGAVIAASLILPLITHGLYVSRWSPLPYDITPAALGFAALVLTFTVFRNQLLDMLPLARRDVIDHLREGVLIADLDGVMIDANPAAEEILGQQRHEIRGRRISAVLAELSQDADHLAALQEAFEALPTGLTLPAAEFRPEDGRRIAMTAKSMGSSAGGPVGRFAVLRDRTQENQYEHFARQVQRLETVGSLAAGIAHEVNNPLAFMRTNLMHLEQVIERLQKQREALPDDEADDLAELPVVVAECVDGIERISRIVESMRRISREPAEEFSEVDVNEIVRQSVRLSDLHRNRHVDICTVLSPELPVIRASAQRMSQVVVNLLLNAKQALARHPDAVVTVETRATADGVDIEVRDNGPGISPEIRHRIFDPFFTTKGPEDGTGLGLSIAFDIVREHGGILEVESREGAGACFVAHFPAYPNAASPPAP